MEIAIDGSLDEIAWTSTSLNQRFHQFEPKDNRPAPQAYGTDVRVLTDDNALIVAIGAWKPPGERVTGTLARCGKVARDQDYIDIHMHPTGHGVWRNSYG